MPATNDATNLFRQTYPKGIVILIYGLIWLIVMFAGFLSFDSIFASGGGAGLTLVIATATAALAGGMGGSTIMLKSLYQRVSISQDFQEQSIFRYLLRPVVGLVAGILALYLIALPGAMLVNFAANGLNELNQVIESPSFAGIGILFGLIQGLFGEILASSTFVAIQILLGWIAGFHQQRGLERLKFLAQADSHNQELAELDEDAPLFFKAAFLRQKSILRWSYTWGLFIFVYGVVWFGALLASYFFVGGLFSGLESNRTTVAAGLIVAAWPVAAAGGLGGVFSLLKDLYEHVSIKQDFHRQHLMAYLVQPIIGLVLGLIMYFLLASGYFSLDSMVGDDATSEVVDSRNLVMLQLLLGWIAGFRQQTVTDMVQQLVQYLITLFKLFGRFLNPANLFNKARRDALLAEIAAETGFFSNIKRDAADTGSSLWATD